MNPSPLRFRMIEAPLVNSDFVKGDERCNYELYIMEIINASKYFSKCMSGPFHPPKSESNGECDAYAGSYGLDFKLIASKTSLHARNIHSYQIFVIDEGEYMECACKRSGTMQVTRLSQALREQPLNALLEMRNKAGKKQGLENDVQGYMKIIETHKNLMMFFPYRFSYDIPGKLEDDCCSIAKAIESDYSVSLKYRSSLYPLLDTYIIFLYDYFFVLCKWNGESVDFLECIPIEKSETFMYLALTYCEEWNEKYDVVLQELRQQKD